MKTLTFLTEGVFGHCSDHLNCNEVIRVFLESTFPNYQENSSKQSLL